VFWQGGQAPLPLADKLTLARHLIALIARHYRH
jgi:phosphopantothenoylcysteine decarboxylase/phosphopantothenate--cysteine ligase